MNFKFLLTIVLPLASALPWDGPQVTATVDFGSLEFFRHDQIGIAAKPGWNPVPTANPRGLDEVWKRASSAAFTSSTIADTCGYLGGSVGSCPACPGLVVANMHSLPSNMRSWVYVRDSYRPECLGLLSDTFSLSNCNDLCPTVGVGELRWQCCMPRKRLCDEMVCSNCC